MCVKPSRLAYGIELVGQLAIRQPAVTLIRPTPPGAGVNFVNGHWSVQPVARGARFEPRGIVPLVAVDIAHNRRRLWAQLRRETVGVGFQSEIAPHARRDFEFVEESFAEPGHENFPYAAGSASAHRERPPIPGIEVANHAHALRVGRPNAEMNTPHAGHFANVRSQFLVFQVVRALAR